GAKRLKSITGTAEGTLSKEALQTKQVRSWAQRELDATRAENAVPSRKAASTAARDAANPPSAEALRKRLARADKRMPEGARQQAKTLKDVSKREYQGGRPANNAVSQKDVLNRAVPQHVPEPMNEGTITRAASDPDQLALLKGRGNPSF